MVRRVASLETKGDSSPGVTGWQLSRTREGGNRARKGGGRNKKTASSRGAKVIEGLMIVWEKGRKNAKDLRPLVFNRGNLYGSGGEGPASMMKRS